MLPETKYVWLGDAQIAYQVIGEGPIDVVFSVGLTSKLTVGSAVERDPRRVATVCGTSLIQSLISPIECAHVDREGKQ